MGKPRSSPGLSSIYISSIPVGGKLRGDGDPVCFPGFRGIGGLTGFRCGLRMRLRGKKRQGRIGC